MSTKDFADKDYYKVLGVSKDAKPEQIKKAFRKIARDNHPDSHPGDKAAEARFKEASEANDVLSDPRKRKEYDQARSLFGAGGGFRFPGGEDAPARSTSRTSCVPPATVTGWETSSAICSAVPDRHVPRPVGPVAGPTSPARRRSSSSMPSTAPR